MVATAYLAAHPPPEGEPKRAMHKSALTGLGLVGAALHQEAPTEPKKKATVRFNRSPTPSSEEEDHDLPRRHKSARHRSRDYDARDALTQCKIDKARAKRVCSSESEMDEDEGELCGARCFSRSVRRTRMPRNFKLPSDTPKFDGTQDPKAWLSDHLSSVKLHGGNKETAMQCLQLQLTGAARIWLNSLSSGSIRSWDELAYSFIRNFKGTSKRPASIEELRSCTQRTGESIRSYILRWSTTKNSAAHISEERAIDAFRDGVKRPDFKEELGRVKPKTLDHLIEIANRWADGEDCIHRAQSDEEDDYGRRRERRSKRRSRVYDDRDGPDMVAACYADRCNDNSRNSGGYRGGNFRDSGRPAQSWQRRDRDNGPSAFDKLSGPCTIHFYIDKQDGKKKASHMLKDCH